MNNRFLIALLACIIILGGIFVATRKKADAPAGGASTTVSNHTYGEGEKGVTLLEYGDFQCPACGAYFPVVAQLKEKYKQDITFQFRHFPLVQIHPSAMVASRAAEAAGLQDKFWEMHDLLFQQQQVWGSNPTPNRFFEDYATQLGLNIDKFKSDLNSPQVSGTINADIKAGQAIGANSTPTFVLDGKKLEEAPRDLAGFSKLIDEAIAKKNAQ